MKVLICGGRDFDGRDWMFKFLDERHAVYGFTHVIHGGAPGADTLADEWARSRGIQPVRCDALWKKQGNAAGPIRNRRMAELLPDLVYAFPGGKGTDNMVTIAEDRGIEVDKVTP